MFAGTILRNASHPRVVVCIDKRDVIEVGNNGGETAEMEEPKSRVRAPAYDDKVNSFADARFTLGECLLNNV